MCIAILAGIGEARDEIAGEGLEEGGLGRFFGLAHAIASAATFGRVFAAVTPAAWRACFLSGVRSLPLALDAATPEEVLAADGNTVRRSREGELGA